MHVGLQRLSLSNITSPAADGAVVLGTETLHNFCAAREAGMFAQDGLVKMGAILVYAGRGNASIEKEHIFDVFSLQGEGRIERRSVSRAVVGRVWKELLEIFDSRLR